MSRGLKISLKVAFWILAAIHFMAAESCENGNRRLKMRVDLGQIETRQFTLPGGGQFDIRFALEQQSEAFLEEANFVIRKTGATVLSSDDLDMKAELLEGHSGMSLLAASEVPECVQDLPMAVIGGAAISFEFQGGARIGVKYNFGFDQDGDLNPTGDAKATIDIQSSELDLMLNAYRPIEGSQIALGQAKPNQTKTKIDAEVNFGGIEFTTEAFLESPLSRVTEKGVKGAIKELDSELSQKLKWTSYVQDVIVNSNGSTAFIWGGKETGILEGDTFDVRRIQHRFSGQECESDYLGNVDLGSVGRLVITGVGDRLSVGRFDGASDFQIQKGHQVVLETLVVPAK